MSQTNQSPVATRGQSDGQPSQASHPHQNAEPHGTADFSGNAVNPSPELLRKIASVLNGGEPDATVSSWAKALIEQYPE